MQNIWREETGINGFILENSSNIVEPQKFYYGKMFKELDSFKHDFSDMITLGFSMNGTSEASALPVGYVFLGQFIDHDLSLDLTGDRFPPAVEIDPTTLENGRQPFLNLDSLYGNGPQDEIDCLLYEHGTCFLKLGLTEKADISGITQNFLNDLPRIPGNTRAFLKERRNDENLGVAQTQVAFIKFHNAVVRLLGGDTDDLDLFEAARKIVVQHYQWIILNDFLPRIIQRDVLTDVIEKKVDLFYEPDGEKPFMPVEFSVAAYRLGHSMVPRFYEWNRIFNSNFSGGNTIKELFFNTGGGGLEGTPTKTLSGRWIIDWRRFYDFTELGFPRPKSTFALKIDRFLPFEFKNIPLTEIVLPGEEYKLSLAVRNLFRGRSIGLPSGQAVADLLNVEKISAAVMAEKLPLDLRSKYAEQTPLWYYILTEAEVLENGERLGPVGSWIVAEVFVRLIEYSPHSILGKEFKEEKWQSELIPEDRRDKFEMADILNFICTQTRLGEMELNPIGNPA
jgi:hypothetical protein